MQQNSLKSDSVSQNPRHKRLHNKRRRKDCYDRSNNFHLLYTRKSKLISDRGHTH